VQERENFGVHSGLIKAFSLLLCSNFDSEQFVKHFSLCLCLHLWHF
jgi:hypothetical protein